MFYSQYYSATEGMSLREKDGMLLAEYQARFLILERIAPGLFTMERQRVAHFVSGVCISIKLAIATFRETP